MIHKTRIDLCCHPNARFTQTQATYFYLYIESYSGEGGTKTKNLWAKHHLCERGVGEGLVQAETSIPGNCGIKYSLFRYPVWTLNPFYWISLLVVSLATRKFTGF